MALQASRHKIKFPTIYPMKITYSISASNIQMAVLPKVRSALCAASQLPGEGPTDVEVAPIPAC